MLQKLALLITPEDKSNKQQNQAAHFFHWQPNHKFSTDLIVRSEQILRRQRIPVQRIISHPAPAPHRPKFNPLPPRSKFNPRRHPPHIYEYPQPARVNPSPRRTLIHTAQPLQRLKRFTVCASAWLRNRMRTKTNICAV